MPGARRGEAVLKLGQIECPDREAALRLQQVLGDAFRALADALLE
ncbi:MAG TPA: hypothetical protein P5534_20290 [Candidatus Paceibacterota bacterium]|nr:hypothetical protein [Candidatus Paceibacterota bacterium]HRZ58349.1 hypothetical protein [Candidatus Paceibacterota bacterium]